QLAQEQRQILAVGGNIGDIGTASCAPTGVARKRRIEGKVAAKACEVPGFDHVHAASCTSCRGTLPIDPAPIVSTMSLSWTSAWMADATPPTCSTNTGSTLPATRNARASARPSAATSGGSPAA